MISGWRLEQAKALRMSPESLVPEHLLRTIAYVQPESADSLIEVPDPLPLLPSPSSLGLTPIPLMPEPHAPYT